MIKEGTFTRKGIHYSDKYKEYIDIRKYIDDNLLHDVEARKTAYELTNTEPEGILAIFFDEDMTQARIEEMYEANETYVEGTFKFSEDRKSHIVTTKLGVYKGVADFGVNAKENQPFLFKLSDVSFVKGDTGTFNTTITGMYVTREPFQERLQIVLDVNTGRIGNYRIRENLLRGHMADENKPHAYDMQSALLEEIHKNRPELIQRGSEYINVMVQTSNLFQTGSRSYLTIHNFITGLGFDAEVVHLFLSINKKTFEANIYV